MQDNLNSFSNSEARDKHKNDQGMEQLHAIQIQVHTNMNLMEEGFYHLHNGIDWQLVHLQEKKIYLDASQKDLNQKNCENTNLQDLNLESWGNIEKVSICPPLCISKLCLRIVEGRGREAPF